MFVVDTNILLYACNRKSQYHQTCHNLLETWRVQSESWFLTWGICYEYLRVVTHPNVFEKPWSLTEAIQFLKEILDSPGAGVLLESDRHLSVVSKIAEEVSTLKGNLFHDAHTAILMREHGIRRLYTHDKDFRHFPFIESIDPIGAEEESEES